MVVKKTGIAPSCNWRLSQDLSAAQFQTCASHFQAGCSFFFFSDKLLLLSNHLKRRLALPTLNASEQFVTACDQVFIKTLFYSGDRARDLGQVKTADIALFPVTVVFSLITSGGKTLQDRASNLFGLRRHPNSACCLVRAIEEYVAFARRLGVSLTHSPYRPKRVRCW